MLSKTKAYNGKKQQQRRIDQSLRLRLRSGLRQSGGRFAAGFDAGLKPGSFSGATAKARAR